MPKSLKRHKFRCGDFANIISGDTNQLPYPKKQNNRLLDRQLRPQSRGDRELAQKIWNGNSKSSFMRVESGPKAVSKHVRHKSPYKLLNTHSNLHILCYSKTAQFTRWKKWRLGSGLCIAVPMPSLLPCNCIQLLHLQWSDSPPNSDCASSSSKAKPCCSWIEAWSFAAFDEASCLPSDFQVVSLTKQPSFITENEYGTIQFTLRTYTMLRNEALVQGVRHLSLSHRAMVSPTYTLSSFFCFAGGEYLFWTVEFFVLPSGPRGKFFGCAFLCGLGFTFRTGARGFLRVSRVFGKLMPALIMFRLPGREAFWRCILDSIWRCRNNITPIDPT